MKKFHSDIRGFTLMELLVYMSIVTIATLIFMSFAVDVTTSAGKSRRLRELQDNARLLISRVTQDIRTADDVAVAGSELRVTKSGVTTRYFLDSGAVKYDDGVGSPLASLSTDSVNISQWDWQKTATSVSVALTVQEKTSASSPQQVELSSTIVPRKLLF
ncbi:MAG: prepilin-type N-terminal cleavage/methylation domain-containing protein [Candidatus Kerfeldbacteria bacterium]|nr:prepilin-type N-terminal cleavage/methylation domain-containing protein [Candidatus Kerfeldbacteria bacterium]